MYSFKVQILDIPVGPSQQTHAFTGVLTVTSKVVLDIKTVSNGKHTTWLEQVA